MGISLHEYERRYTAIREQMAQQDIDCLVVVGQADDFNRGNIRYVTGFGRGGCCLLPARGKPVMFLSSMVAASPKLPRLMSALELLEIMEIVDLDRQIVEVLSRLDHGGRIGVVGGGCMSVSMHQVVSDFCKERYFDAVAIFESLRAVKSAEEIEKTRMAAAIADKVFLRLREIIRPGLSEYQIYGEVKKVIYENGCEYSFDLIDAAHASMNMSFVPTEDQLEEGGTLFMEISPSFQGYYAQLPVTLPVGYYSPVLKKMVTAWNQADTALQKILKPGTSLAELNTTLIETIEAFGFKSPYRPGHSIGLDILDFWSITKDSRIILKPGMIFAIHPSVLIEMGGDACGMGYTYLITQSGAERLSRIDLFAELLGG